jgi:hypothetical protein
LSDEPGQQQVNRIARLSPISPEPIWLNGALCEFTREHAKPAASTFNPKVAGSIPARPIKKGLLAWLLIRADHFAIR